MLKLYRWLTFFLLPFALLTIFYRSIFNKEDRLRYKEKIFSSAFNSNRNSKKKIILVSRSKCRRIFKHHTFIKRNR